MRVQVAYETRSPRGKAAKAGKGPSCEPFDRQGKRNAAALRTCLRKGRIVSDQKLAYLIGDDMRARERESFVVVGVNRDGELLTYEEVARGQRHRVAVDVRDILQVAVRHGCDAFAVAHNHPTSGPEPSPKDKKLTKAVEKGAKAAGVVFLDHLIFARDGRYYSFRDGKAKKAA